MADDTAAPPRHPGSITDIAGLYAGHAEMAGRATGCSVVLCPHGVVAGVSVRGGAPGTRDTDLLRPENTVDRVHALVLTGGSAFGLDAAGGVMRWLDDAGHGLDVAGVRVPIVPAAVLFDLWLGDSRIRPDARCGRAACDDAAVARWVGEGSVGAGAGATVGKLYGRSRATRGGVGTASLASDGATVAALVAVNAVGDVVSADGRVLAGVRSADGRRVIGWRAARDEGATAHRALAGSATTIGVVATDARLTKSQATQLAHLAHAGIARAVDPLTPHDGDTLFALATGGVAGEPDLVTLGALAADAVAAAIRNAVLAAMPLADPPLPAAGDRA